MQFRRLFEDHPSAFSGTPSAPTAFSRTIRRTQVCKFKKLDGEEKHHSVRIGLEYRALAVMKKDGIVWYWIGSRSAYDRLA